MADEVEELNALNYQGNRIQVFCFNASGGVVRRYNPEEKGQGGRLKAVLPASCSVSHQRQQGLKQDGLLPRIFKELRFLEGHPNQSTFQLLIERKDVDGQNKYASFKKNDLQRREKREKTYLIHHNLFVWG